ncbi:hypothetical protein [Mesonia sp.]|uniref:hypothetical protein n=1 Tax=Mesonia sp. TaxID=1960830 RepID=UPI0017769C88|nr:hypothetical protein [Mesonia sp.]HIB36277.1 hypothetical protein [Mesonia sp.]HIO26002.1 hypothetical protein [Flavobacteriaceae bacterium]
MNLEFLLYFNIFGKNMQIMKNLFILLIIVVTLQSCQKETKNINDPRPLGDINIVLDSPKHKIDSIAVFSVNNEKKVFDSTKYDTLKFNMSKPLNDIYKIEFFSEKHITPVQVWLDGEHPIIDISIDRFAKIEKVSNSPLNKHIKDYSKQLEELYKDPEANNEKIDKFLLEEIEENSNSPFAFAPAEVYYYKNQENQQKIRKLDSILDKLPAELKTHKLNLYNNVNKTIQKN